MRTAVATAACVLVATGGFAADMPKDFDDMRTGWEPSYAWLLDRDGVVLEVDRLEFDGLRAPWVALDDVSPALREAVVAIEDRRFRMHGGVDWRAAAAAAWQSLAGRGRRGASTITMQLSGLIGPEAAALRGRRGLRSKWAQMRAAWRLEGAWTKDQILEAYLNRVSFRGELQGVGAATQSLLGKAPSGLTAAEAWLLASLIAAPNAEPARVAARACAIARHRRADVGCVELSVLAQRALAGAPEGAPLPSLAPQLARVLLRRPGERLTTTLSAPLQRKARDALARQLGSLDARNARDGAAVVVDNATGEVLAYVGSAGPHSSSAAVDGVRALRQAGSTLKPFLYGLAFERRYLTPASLLEDSPINLETTTGLYIPQNYDRRHMGVVSARTALAASLNIPAVRTLILVGVEKFRDRLSELGYDAIDEDGKYYGFSLALGSAEVNLLQQANAYRALANGGLSSPLTLVPTAGRSTPPSRVMPASVAFLVSDILSDPAARAASFGFASPLAIPFWAAVKTGTSKDMRDNWCVGFSDRYTVAVWVGNFEGDSMTGVSGVTGAAPAWAEIMQALHEGHPSRAPAVPSGLVARRVEFAPAVEPPRQSWFLAGTELSRIELLAKGPATARIASPANGAVVALDPDIPAANQLMLFEGRGTDASLAFYLDGRRLGSSERPRKWAPRPGDHRVELRTADGRVRDVVRFRVRGPIKTLTDTGVDADQGAVKAR
jgi:penicillin-binding protein 1C